MKHHRNSYVTLLIAAILLLGPITVIPASAQIEFSDDAHWETLSNRYISISLGVRGTVKPDPNETYHIGGRWSVSTTEGDPETSKDNTRGLIWFAEVCPAEYFAYWRVRIGDTVRVIGDFNSGHWSKLPLAYPVPPAGLGLGRAGGFIEGEWTVTEGDQALARVRIRMSIVRDQARFELNLVNAGSTTQNMGLLMLGDVLVDDTCSTAYAYLPGRGHIRSATAVAKPLGLILTGNDIPEYFDTYDNVENPVVVARNILKQQDCVAPDYLVLGEWGEMIGANTWVPEDYRPDEKKPVDDLAWSLCWSPRSLRPGASRKIVTYFGVGAASAQWNYRVGMRMEPDSAVLAVQGPRSLKYDSVNNTVNDLDPGPFTVKAYLYNLATDAGPYDLDDVTVSLYLPNGLELTPGQTARQTIGRVPVNSESLPAAWQVQATGDYCGELEYFVTARAASGWQQVVSRKVMVPATKKSIFRSGYQLMHVPFVFNNPAADHAFRLSAGAFGARRYDPVSGQYLPVTQLKPGQAFWMYVVGVQRGRTLPFELAADAAIVGEEYGKQAREQYIDLLPGWNLVGNPFVYPVYWGQVQVYNKVTNTTLSLDRAVTSGWLSNTVFSWVPESGTYEHFKENDRLLLPWRGYWVRAKSPCTLVFRPAVAPGSDVTANPGGY